jgi:uncharacterized protein (DUF983 family)
MENWNKESDESDRKKVSNAKYYYLKEARWRRTLQGIDWRCPQCHELKLRLREWVKGQTICKECARERTSMDEDRGRVAVQSMRLAG